MDKQIIESEVRNWVETVVIDLNLCPFAKKEMIRNTVRFYVSAAATEEDLLLALHNELRLIQSDITIETSLLIHPNVLNDFLAYNQFLEYAEDLLAEMQLEGVFQIASFHPQYQFADALPDTAENYTNRSPYPMLHILREDSLTAAIDHHPNINEVPNRNITLLREMGVDKMKALLKGCFVRHKDLTNPDSKNHIE